MKLSISSAITEEAVQYVADNMRQADRDEVWASNAYGAEQALRKSIEASRDTVIAWSDERPLCIFGVGAFTPFAPSGAPWMLGVDGIFDKGSFELLRLSQRFVSVVKEDWPLLLNYVDVRNAKAVKWLRWLGFEIHDPQPYGPFELPFHKFTMGE